MKVNVINLPLQSSNARWISIFWLYCLHLQWSRLARVNL